MNDSSQETLRAPRERLANELQAIIQDAEALLNATASEKGEKADSARAKMKDALERAKANYSSLEGRALAHAKAADEVIRRHPYETLGVGFGLGLVLGLLLNRR